MELLIIFGSIFLGFMLTIVGLIIALLFAATKERKVKSYKEITLKDQRVID